MQRVGLKQFGILRRAASLRTASAAVTRVADHRSLLSDRRRSGTGRRQRFPASGNYLSALVPRVATWTLAAYCPLASHSLSIRRIELDRPPGMDPEICVGNHFEYSEVHVLQLPLITSTMTAAVRRPRGGGRAGLDLL